MIQSKVSCFLRNIRSKIPHDAGSSRLFQCRLFSQQHSNELIPNNPDKLYEKVEMEVRGNDRAVLWSYGQFVVMVAKNLNINVLRNTAPRKAVHERYTVLKSVHIYKKHRVQYETRTYYRFIDFVKLTGSTADTLLEYLQRNLPEGVAMKVTKVELHKLPESVIQS